MRICGCVCTKNTCLFVCVCVCVCFMLLYLCMTVFGCMCVSARMRMFVMQVDDMRIRSCGDGFKKWHVYRCVVAELTPNKGIQASCRRTMNPMVNYIKNT